MRPPRPRAVLALLIAILMVAAACSEADLDLGMDPIPKDLELEALADVETFWSEQYPLAYGDQFEPVAGGFLPYGPDTRIPDCGPQELDYSVAADNAFYCTFDDYIAWDDVGLLAQVEDDYGPLAVGVIMAHEYGHAIQARADSFDGTPTIFTELQADCFAGAWASDVDGRIPYFTSDDGNLEAAIAGFIELLRDAPGSNPNAATAHGSAFDRVSAFQEGYDDGVDACVPYTEEDGRPVITQMPFQSAQEAANEGNLPTDRLLELLPVSLEAFYAELFEQIDGRWDPLDDIVLLDPEVDTVSCNDDAFEDEELEYFSLYCAEDDTIYLDAVDLLADLEEIGDMAVGGELARLYAVDAQRQLDISGSAEDLGRHADCLTGVFISAMFTESIPIDDPDLRLVLSSGDFDEIVIVFLLFSDESSSVSPVDRISDFRVGFLDGFGACEDYVS